MNKNSSTDTLNKVSKDIVFLTGVVEGFYGVPWTTEQRRKLFKRMQSLGLNTYVYAPKDDAKHRVYWREPYSVEESDHLTSLIESATKSGIQFIYALSPGLDIIYSNSKEIAFLKRKLQQVVSFGCKAFALLFDDIDTDMCATDKQSFQSIAQAQVAVANEVYEHLGMPCFLFCPTEYCASRAIPSVQNSEYLHTVGSRLLSGIDILWTGPNVVSKKISIESIEEITKVIRRPPIIWDNLHANDYDSKRLFLGPYDGRSPELIPILHGVLTNPNCEFEANYIALHTLSQWCRCEVDGLRPDHPLDSPAVMADIKLEREGDSVLYELSTPSLPLLCSYNPRKALEVAIRDWLTIIHEECAFISKKMAVAAPPSIVPPLASALASPVSSPPIAPSGLGVDPFLQPPNVNSIRSDVSMTFLPSATRLPVNSLVDPQVSSSEDEDSGTESNEPMDLVGGLVTGGPAPSGPSLIPLKIVPIVEDEFHGSSDVELGSAKDSVISENDVMQIDTIDHDRLQDSSEIGSVSMPTQAAIIVTPTVTESDISLLTEFFYLPFEYGCRSLEILNDIVWLRSNADLLSGLKNQKKSHKIEDQKEWCLRAQKLQGIIMQVYALFDRLCAIPNKALIMEIFPYMWDMKATLSILSSFIEWLAQSHMNLSTENYTITGSYNWANQMYRDYFASGQGEPWIYRGGLQGEIQRLLPVDSVLDLFYPIFPSIPNTRLMMSIHPYVEKHKEKVYEICRCTYDDGMDGTDMFPDHLNLIGDKMVGPFLRFSPEYCFVIEDDVGICGYVVAAIDAQSFCKKIQEEWIPEMQEKYKNKCQVPLQTQELAQSNEEELTSFWKTYKPFFSEDIYACYPSLIKLDILASRCMDPSAARRAMACAIAALKMNHSHGLYTELHVCDRNSVDVYTKLGFLDVNMHQASDDLMIMGRIL